MTTYTIQGSSGEKFSTFLHWESNPGHSGSLPSFRGVKAEYPNQLDYRGVLVYRGGSSVHVQSSPEEKRVLDFVRGSNPRPRDVFWVYRFKSHALCQLS